MNTMTEKPKHRFEAAQREALGAMTVRERALLALYPWLTAAIPRPVVLGLVRRWARRNPGEESVERARERLALDQPARPPGRVVWLHSIGPGDSTANLTLIHGLRQLDPSLAFLVTTRTVAAQGVFKKFATDDNVVTLLAPLDSPVAMRRFLDHWNVSLAAFCEWDLWPNMARMLHERGVPIALVNAQFNGRMGRNLENTPGLGRWLMNHVDVLHIFREECEDAARSWVRPGAVCVRMPNLKMDAPALQPKAELAEEMRRRWQDQPVLTCASIANEEVETLLDAFRIAKERIPGLRLILVPRWKEQSDAIERTVASHRTPAPRRSIEGLPEPEDDVFIADSYGEMGTWFDLSFAVFMGHTLFGGHGHNAFEPVLQERPVISGSIPAFLAPDYTYLVELGLCHIAPTAEEIAEKAIMLFRERERGADRFDAFRQDRGFSIELCRRLLALADASNPGAKPS